MIIQKETTATMPKGVWKSKGETDKEFLNNLIQAYINDKMPSLPYPIEHTEWQDISALIYKYEVQASYQGITRGKENFNKRKELWNQINTKDI